MSNVFFNKHVLTCCACVESDGALGRRFSNMDVVKR